jgi:hypothetical protein
LAQGLPKEARTEKHPVAMILTKTTKEQQQQNTRILSQFEFAFITCDLDQLKNLLDDQGIYFGRTKANALAYWNKLFLAPEGLAKYPHAHVNRGYSRYGSEVLEIRMNKTITINHEGIPQFRTFGEEVNRTADERVFRFTFSFREGKICGVQRPREYTADIEKFVELN